MSSHVHKSWDQISRRGLGKGNPIGRGVDTWGQGRGRTQREGGKNFCRYYQAGRCHYGESCKFSHGSRNFNMQTPSDHPRERKKADVLNDKARADYSAWKRLIKAPPTADDTWTVRKLWAGALTILDAEDRDWKQMLPRDLDNDEEYYGRDHIHVLMGMVALEGGSCEFIDLAHSFLMVMTHSAMLDCLSVDIFVGNLYNYISGSNGSRAIPFFRNLINNLSDAHQSAFSTDVESTSAETLNAMSTAICEVLKRVPRAAFHEDLPGLLDSLGKLPEVIGMSTGSVACQKVAYRITELRSMVARANGLINLEQPRAERVSTTIVTSTYPRTIVMPGDRHDNDQMDITKIKIIPTEDEIRSNHPEFLPSTDPDQPHFLVDAVARHLDTHFRLLRHDVFGELKEALGGLMIAVQNDPALIFKTKFNLGDIRAYSYPRAQIRHISYNQRQGLEVQISFPQPSQLRNKLPPNRRTWWEESRRLEEGVLLCFWTLQDAQSSLILFTVSQKSTDPKQKYGLSCDDHQSTISAKLAAWSQSDMANMIRLSCSNTKGLLIEFPGILLGTFIPILKTLQDMLQLSRMPFRQWILPDRIGTQENTSSLDIPPPLYSRSPRFMFSLKAILNDPNDDLLLSPGTSVDDVATLDELEEKSCLDRGQCRALIAALSREYAFIQGPPGTGKTYLGVQLMRTLLSCKIKADLGPIVVVCYTNHALDQFLEHLIKIGIDKVIRIGGQSHSTILEGKNLRTISQAETKTKFERYLVAKTYGELENAERSITKQLKTLHSIQKRPGWLNLQRHLNSHYPRIHAQFSCHDKDGYEMVGRPPFDIWASGTTATDIKDTSGTETSPALDELLSTAQHNVHLLSQNDRVRLVEHWVEELREDITDQVFDSIKWAENERLQLSNTHDDVDRRVLQTADVIGVTTTGLAKRIATLKHIKCKIVICEEAGEVMEPHMLSALLPSVEHFIQIGDHQQLRPQINNYGLSLESQQGARYQLDRSQFERLSVGESGRPKFPVAQLNVQRRMRPEISTLIRETIYPRLVDHETVKNFPDVVGMRKNVFWMDHENMEEGNEIDVHQKSHSNLWEVDFTHALVRHIVRQGAYKSSEIAVLTPYTGQLQKLRAKMRDDFEIVLSDRDQEKLANDGFDDEEIGYESSETNPQPVSEKRPLERKKLAELLRISTVDNFQGEESLIVIVSLVRSNKEKRVGFLKTTNRANVLLSRAQHGLYIIGNVDTCSKIPIWATTKGMLQATESVGKALGLCCPRHPDTEIEVCRPDDFARLSPEGGCRLTCDKRLSRCGHRCQARCHSESLHEAFLCPQPCQRLHSLCKHSCQKATCGEDCGVCLVKLDNVPLPCSHLMDNVACHQTQEVHKIKCDTIVSKQVPSCGHIVQTKCWQDVTAENFKCRTPCGANLPCGHSCPGSCSRCQVKNPDGNTAIKHQKCTKICGRGYGTCNHVCPQQCHDGVDCGLCTAQCEVRCAHSNCNLRCFEPCAPCIESCTWSCEHKSTCGMPCAAPCIRLPCNLRCSRSLPCGHQCPAVCGESCPAEYCHTCGTRADQRVDLLEMKTYMEVDPDENPIVVLGCGHFFTAETLDGLMGMGEVYIRDRYGEFTGLKDISAGLAQSIPRCPDCQCPVRQYATQRYNRTVNRAVIDEMSKRFLVNGQDKLRTLEEKASELEQTLEASCKDIENAIYGQKNDLPTIPAYRDISKITIVLKERKEKTAELQIEIRSYCKKFADGHQPVQKLHDATIHATRSRDVTEKLTNLSLVESVPAIPRDRRITFRARLVKIRVEHIGLKDMFSIIQAALKSANFQAASQILLRDPGKLTHSYFKTCKKFIEDCYAEDLPKLGVEASLYYAGIARPYDSYCRSAAFDTEKATLYLNVAKLKLREAMKMCAKGFENADRLAEAIEDSLKLLTKQWYEEVTAEELAAIKTAMISGSQGIATHSGHWYNCANGHPFAIGECGMPMEQARCPECGALVGGQNHQAVDGVTRATNLET